METRLLFCLVSPFVGSMHLFLYRFVESSCGIRQLPIPSLRLQSHCSLHSQCEAITTSAAQPASSSQENILTPRWAERRFLTHFCSHGFRTSNRRTKGVLVAVENQETKSGLAKGKFLLCQISSECRGGAVLAHLLPQLCLPTARWNEMASVSRNFRSTPCTSRWHRVDS